MNFRPKQVEEIDVNLAPLIDVVFLLLIFFMVSTTFDQKTELSIDLPEAKGDIVETDDKPIEIAIDDAGNFFIDKKPTNGDSTKDLVLQLGQVIKNKKEPSVIISADKNTPHQSVMRIMDAARRLNLSHLTFAAVKID